MMGWDGWLWRGFMKSKMAFVVLVLYLPSGGSGGRVWNREHFSGALYYRWLLIKAVRR